MFKTLRFNQNVNSLSYLSGGGQEQSEEHCHPAGDRQDWRWWLSGLILNIWMNIFTRMWLMFPMQFWSLPTGVNQSTNKYFNLTTQKCPVFFLEYQGHHRKSLGLSKSHSDKLVLFGHWLTVNLYRDNVKFAHECQHSSCCVKGLRIYFGGIKYPDGNYFESCSMLWIPLSFLKVQQVF